MSIEANIGHLGAAPRGVVLPNFWSRSPKRRFRRRYSYLDDPEIVGGAAWLGMGLISGSKLVLSLSYWRFLRSVKKYVCSSFFLRAPCWLFLFGIVRTCRTSLRKEARFVKVIKSVASKNARILESRAGKHALELRAVEKVLEETGYAVEELLAKCEFSLIISASCCFRPLNVGTSETFVWGGHAG